MRLLIYSLYYAPDLVGIAKYTGEMAAWLAARGHHVEVVASPPHYPEWRVRDGYRGQGFHVEELEGVRVMRVPTLVPGPERVHALNRILYETSFCVASLRYWLPMAWRGKRHDAVIAVCPPLQVALWPWLMHALHRIPWVLHVQDLQVDAALGLGILKPRALARPLAAIERFLLRRASAVSTITERMRLRILDKGVDAQSCWTFPNWADAALFQAVPRDNEFRAALGADDDDVVVMYAGNMGRKQGLDQVLDAAGTLRGRKDMRFVMVGHGADQPRLLRRARSLELDNVTFLPLQPLDTLPRMLAAADVHLVVQKREAANLVMPSKLSNIMAVGRASLATAEPHTTLYQVLTEHDAGLVTPPGDRDAFTAALERLADDAELRARLAGGARRYAENHLDKQALLEAFESRLRSLVESSAAPPC